MAHTLCACSEREKLLGMSGISFITIFFLTRQVWPQAALGLAPHVCAAF